MKAGIELNRDVFTPRLNSVMIKQGNENDDRNRHTEQPEKNSASHGDDLSGCGVEIEFKRRCWKGNGRNVFRFLPR